QEMHDMVRAAFDLSERYGTLVLIRSTTRVNHQSSLVDVGEMVRTPFERIQWQGQGRQFKTVGEAARAAKARLLERMAIMRAEMDDTGWDRLERFDGEALRPLDTGSRDEPFGVITAGVCYLYSLESLMGLEVPAGILKIGVLNPLPEEAIARFVEPLETVVVVEELSSYIEDAVTRIAKDVNPGLRIVGKRSGHLPEMLEFNVPIVARALSQASGRPLPFDHFAHLERMNAVSSILPPRLPVFCAGCPHRATFWSLIRAVRDRNAVFLANDIGCYSMACLEPMNWTDSMLAMGAGIGVATGAQHAAMEKVVAMIGDSTLFHAGLPAVVNAVHHDDDITLIVLDNAVTAMTGQQSHPGGDRVAGGAAGKKVDIEAALRGLGVERIFNIDSYDAIKNVKAIREAIDHDGFSVVISHQECALYHFRNYRKAGGKIVPFRVDKDACRKAYNCIRNFMCPAISIDPEDGKARIAPEVCVGCGVCAKLCGFKAIHSTAVDMGGEDRAYIEAEDYATLGECCPDEGVE
ncbi:MAG: thiamine pyrophosphate-dependent enzyme, partial [Thermoplasmata archaeon]|nr:thiamine pyrophosphate-dependent enzyme [Thermoplasmata archaeon]